MNKELKNLRLLNLLRAALIFILVPFLIGLFSPPSVFAARKRIRVKRRTRKTAGSRRSFYGAARSMVKLRGDRRALLLTISGMENCKSLSYKLTYTANGVPQGVMGKIDPALEPTAKRELLFGTCSRGVCTYHRGLANMRLLISSHLKSGITVIKPYRIKP